MKRQKLDIRIPLEEADSFSPLERRAERKKLNVRVPLEQADSFSPLERNSSPPKKKSENKTRKRREENFYPDLDDPHFNQKIAEKKEFQTHTYDGTIHDDPKQKANEECIADFEILPHQQFAKTFMSSGTPYNSLLLYHELGTGKTCSAIGIAEESRAYMQQAGIQKEIFVVASPNVLENFKLQLFDKSKLVEEKIGMGSVWNLNNCVGNALIKEINPMEIQGLTKEMIVSYIELIIRKYYRFMGYGSFVNRILQKVPEIATFEEIKKGDLPEILAKKKLVIAKTQKIFDHRLIIVDEAHNMIERENQNKQSSFFFHKLVLCCRHLHILFLTATPMYNSYEEIIWLTNMMNLNDRRSQIDVSQVFTSNGDFVIEKKDTQGDVLVESGRDLLRRKLTGYISYVRGESPYTFPNRLFPDQFESRKEFVMKNIPYPKKQIDGKEITPPARHIINLLYCVPLGAYQKKVYKKWADGNRTRVLSAINTIEPLSLLNIVFPHTNQADEVYHSEKGLYDVVKKQINPTKFSYINKSTAGCIFAPKEISKYSGKIAEIVGRTLKSSGIVLIYSKYIASGVIPIALTLEEHGFRPYNKARMLESASLELGALTMKRRNGNEPVASYVMITGNKELDSDTHFTEIIEIINSVENKEGAKIKVVIISDTGSEGLDFKCIRQVHVLNPWYNMSQIEQTIGRAVRNKSHCRLDYEARNVEIYLYASFIPDDEEMIDLFVYRMAEEKAIKMGKITRLIKECAVDCLLNIDQVNFSEKNMQTHKNQKVKQISSCGTTLDFPLGDKPFSSKCDYLESCEWVCHDTPSEKTETDDTTYRYSHLKNNHPSISKIVRLLFRERATYLKTEIVDEILRAKMFPIEQIYFSLSIFLKNKDWIVHNEKKGHMIEIKDFYAFQPFEITDRRASMFDRISNYYRKASHIVVKEESVKKAPRKRQKKNPDGQKQFADNEPDIVPELTDSDSDSDSDSEDDQPLLQSIFEEMDRIDGNRIEKKNTMASIGNEQVFPWLKKNKFDAKKVRHAVLVHFLDCLEYSQKEILLKQLFAKEEDFVPSKETIVDEIKNYFLERIVRLKNVYYAYIADVLERQNVVLKWDKKWMVDKSNEWRQKKNVTAKIREKITIELADLTEMKDTTIGYIGSLSGRIGFYFKSHVKKDGLFIFKNAAGGAFAPNCNKKELHSRITNLLLFHKLPFNDKSMSQSELVVLYEILMRYFVDHLWFVSPEEAIDTNLIATKGKPEYL